MADKSGPNLINPDNIPRNHAGNDLVANETKIMEKLRRSQASLQASNWTETNKLFKLSMIERKQIAGDNMGKPNVEKQLETLQKAFKVHGLRGVCERLETLAPSCGMHFRSTGDHHHSSSAAQGCVLEAECMRIEVLLDSRGQVKQVVLRDDGEREGPQNCRELCKLINEGRYDELEEHIKAMQKIYSIGADRKQKCRVFSTLQAMETDLLNCSKFQSAISDVANLILKSPLGIVVPRAAGRAMRLVYFISPYELVDEKSKSLKTITAERVMESELGSSVTVNIEASSQYKLQNITLLSTKTQDGKSLPSFMPLNKMNSCVLPAVFVLRLSKPLPVARSIINSIHNATGLELSEPGGELDYKPLSQLIIQSLIDDQDQQNDKLCVCLPDQKHSYSLNCCSDCDDQLGALVTHIPFQHPTNVARVLQLLRTQTLYNTVIGSCVRQHAECGGDGLLTFEVTAVSLQAINVTFEHPHTDAITTAAFDLSDVSAIKCSVHTSGLSAANQRSATSPAPSASTVIQRCLSLPLTMRHISRMLAIGLDAGDVDYGGDEHRPHIAGNRSPSPPLIPQPIRFIPRSKLLANTLQLSKLGQERRAAFAESRAPPIRPVAMANAAAQGSSDDSSGGYNAVVNASLASTLSRGHSSAAGGGSIPAINSPHLGSMPAGSPFMPPPPPVPGASSVAGSLNATTSAVHSINAIPTPISVTHKAQINVNSSAHVNAIHTNSSPANAHLIANSSSMISSSGVNNSIPTPVSSAISNMAAGQMAPSTLNNARIATPTSLSMVGGGGANPTSIPGPRGVGVGVPPVRTNTPTLISPNPDPTQTGGYPSSKITDTALDKKDKRKENPMLASLLDHPERESPEPVPNNPHKMLSQLLGDSNADSTSGTQVPVTHKSGNQTAHLNPQQQLIKQQQVQAQKRKRKNMADSRDSQGSLGSLSGSSGSGGSLQQQMPGMSPKRLASEQDMLNKGLYPGQMGGVVGPMGGVGVGGGPMMGHHAPHPSAVHLQSGGGGVGNIPLQPPLNMDTTTSNHFSSQQSSHLPHHHPHYHHNNPHHNSMNVMMAPQHNHLGAMQGPGLGGPGGGGGAGGGGVGPPNSLQPHNNINNAPMSAANFHTQTRVGGVNHSALYHDSSSLQQSHTPPSPGNAALSLAPPIMTSSSASMTSLSRSGATSGTATSSHHPPDVTSGTPHVSTSGGVMGTAGAFGESHVSRLALSVDNFIKQESNDSLQHQQHGGNSSVNNSSSGTNNNTSFPVCSLSTVTSQQQNMTSHDSSLSAQHNQFLQNRNSAFAAQGSKNSELVSLLNEDSNPKSSIRPIKQESNEFGCDPTSKRSHFLTVDDSVLKTDFKQENDLTSMKVKGSMEENDPFEFTEPFLGTQSSVDGAYDSNHLPSSISGGLDIKPEHKQFQSGLKRNHSNSSLKHESDSNSKNMYDHPKKERKKFRGSDFGVGSEDINKEPTPKISMKININTNTIVRQSPSHRRSESPASVTALHHHGSNSLNNATPDIFQDSSRDSDVFIVNAGTPNSSSSFSATTGSGGGGAAINAHGASPSLHGNAAAASGSMTSQSGGHHHKLSNHIDSHHHHHHHHNSSHKSWSGKSSKSEEGKSKKKKSSRHSSELSKHERKRKRAEEERLRAEKAKKQKVYDFDTNESEHLPPLPTKIRIRTKDGQMQIQTTPTGTKMSMSPLPMKSSIGRSDSAISESGRSSSSKSHRSEKKHKHSSKNKQKSSSSHSGKPDRGDSKLNKTPVVKIKPLNDNTEMKSPPHSGASTPQSAPIMRQNSKIQPDLTNSTSTATGNNEKLHNHVLLGDTGKSRSMPVLPPVNVATSSSNKGSGGSSTKEGINIQAGGMKIVMSGSGQSLVENKTIVVPANCVSSSGGTIVTTQSKPKLVSTNAVQPNCVMDNPKNRTSSSSSTSTKNVSSSSSSGSHTVENKTHNALEQSRNRTSYTQSSSSGNSSVVSDAIRPKTLLTSSESSKNRTSSVNTAATNDLLAAKSRSNSTPDLISGNSGNKARNGGAGSANDVRAKTPTNFTPASGETTKIRATSGSTTPTSNASMTSSSGDAAKSRYFLSSAKSGKSNAAENKDNRISKHERSLKLANKAAAPATKQRKNSLSQVIDKLTKGLGDSDVSSSQKTFDEIRLKILAAGGPNKQGTPLPKMSMKKIGKIAKTGSPSSKIAKLGAAGASSKSPNISIAKSPKVANKSSPSLPAKSPSIPSLVNAKSVTSNTLNAHNKLSNKQSSPNVLTKHGALGNKDPSSKNSFRIPTNKMENKSHGSKNDPRSDTKNAQNKSDSRTMPSGDNKSSFHKNDPRKANPANEKKVISSPSNAATIVNNLDSTKDATHPSQNKRPNTHASSNNRPSPSYTPPQPPHRLNSKDGSDKTKRYNIDDISKRLQSEQSRHFLDAVVKPSGDNSSAGGGNANTENKQKSGASPKYNSSHSSPSNHEVKRSKSPLIKLPPKKPLLPTPSQPNSLHPANKSLNKLPDSSQRAHNIQANRPKTPSSVLNAKKSPTVSSAKAIQPDSRKPEVTSKSESEGGNVETSQTETSTPASPPPPVMSFYNPAAALKKTTPSVISTPPVDLIAPVARKEPIVVPLEKVDVKTTVTEPPLQPSASVADTPASPIRHETPPASPAMSGGSLAEKKSDATKSIPLHEANKKTVASPVVANIASPDEKTIASPDVISAASCNDVTPASPDNTPASPDADSQHPAINELKKVPVIIASEKVVPKIHTSKAPDSPHSDISSPGLVIDDPDDVIAPSTKLAPPKAIPLERDSLPKVDPAPEPKLKDATTIIEEENSAVTKNAIQSSPVQANVVKSVVKEKSPCSIDDSLMDEALSL